MIDNGDYPYWLIRGHPYEKLKATMCRKALYLFLAISLESDKNTKKYHHFCRISCLTKINVAYLSRFSKVTSKSNDERLYYRI